LNLNLNLFWREKFEFEFKFEFILGIFMIPQTFGLFIATHFMPYSPEPPILMIAQSFQ